MPETTLGNTESTVEATLPKRDWVLMPIIGVMTICLLLTATELTARQLFTWKSGLASCVDRDELSGARWAPNTICREKERETEMIEYRFNSCGDRTGMECRAKPDGSYRIVMTGSCIGMGLQVERDQAFAALLPKELSQQTGRRVELYYTALGYIGGGVPLVVASRFNRVLAANPDMFLWVLSPYDIEHARDPIGNTNAAHAAMPKGPLAKDLQIRDTVNMHSLGAVRRTAFEIWNRSRSCFMLQHYLYSSQSIYVRQFLTGSDSEQGFLKAQLSRAWLDRLRQVDSSTAAIEVQAKAAGLPLVVAYLPDRAQTAMISTREWPAGYDPYKLDNDLRSIITSRGGIYLDIVPGYRNIPNPEHYYFPVDGHPDAGGHKIIADLLARELTNGAIPALKAPAQPATTVAKVN